MLKSSSMGYEDSISYLYGLRKHGLKFGLDGIRRLLSLIGNPQDSYRSVHIAGTNGKGSTSAMIEAILRQAGHKTGLFTSPHLISFTERIRVSGEEITEAEVISLTEEMREAIKEIDFSPTFFEFVTAMGFLYFKRKGVERAVVETGMGGRLDATNVLKPEVTIITPIGLDHREFLGGTLREIASEKAGIIKKAVPVVSARQEPEAIEAIREKAKESDAPLYLEDADFRAQFKGHSDSGIVIDYESPSLTLRDVEVSLRGRHQARNAAMAIKAIEIIEGPDAQVEGALRSLRWPGRLEIISSKPEILIDGAHNPPAAETLAQALKEVYASKGRKINLIMGVMSDKDIDGILGPLLPLAGRIIFTAPSFDRAESPDALKERAKALGYDSETAASVKEAIALATKDSAKNLAKNLDNITVITGSFYTIGEAKEAVSGLEAALKGLREDFRGGGQR